MMCCGGQGEGMPGVGDSAFSNREGTVGRGSSVISERVPFPTREKGEGTQRLSPRRIPKPAVLILHVYSFVS